MCKMPIINTSVVKMMSLTTYGAHFANQAPSHIYANFPYGNNCQQSKALLSTVFNSRLEVTTTRVYGMPV